MVSAFPLPVNLTDNPYVDDEVRSWIAELPGIVSGLADRWSLHVGEPYQPGGYCSWVAPASTADGRDLVLKVGFWHYEAEHEADGLKLWNGDGAVTLYDHHGDEQTSALLLERCRPGTALADVMRGPEQDVVLAGLLRRLWREPPDGHPFRPLQQMCDAWALEFEEKLEKVPGHIDPGLARAGMALFRSLPASADRSVLLCTDLHSENVLAAEREPWLVIDPKPYVGDPTYDVLQYMIYEKRTREDPDQFTARMADLLDLDVARLRLWLFARCVQACIGMPQLRAVAKRLAPG